MKTETTDEKMVLVSESVLLSLVADKIRGKVLFPEQVRRAKEYLKNIDADAFAKLIKR
jgi:hypothetical protein